MSSQTIDTLIIKIQADMQGVANGLAKAEKELQNFSVSVDKQTSYIGGAFKKLGVTALAYFSMQTVKQVYSTISSFQELQTSLISVTGSAQNADAAFSMLRDVALNTPFSIEEVTKTYIRLKSLGIDPTAETLKALGNVAAATGKDLAQYSEAARKAIHGQMDGLAQFGVSAEKQNNKLKLTFQGTTTVIGDNAAEITKYLQHIGNVKYGDAMALQNETARASLNNLYDAVKNLIIILGDTAAGTGLGSAFASITNVASSFLNNISKSISEVYDAQTELNKAREQALEYENMLNAGIGRKSPFYSEIFNVKNLLNDKRAEIARLEDEVKQQKEGKSGIDQMQEFDLSLLPGKKNIDYLQSEMEFFSNLGLSDFVLERKELRNQLSLLNTEYMKNALGAEAYARASKTLNDRLTEMESIHEEVSKMVPFPTPITEHLGIKKKPPIREDNQLEDFAQAAESLKTNLISLSMSGIGTLEDSMLSLVNGTKSVKESFTDMANSIINDIIRMTLRQQISAPIAAALGNIIGSIGGSVIPDGLPVGGSLNQSVLQRQTMDFFRSNISLGRAGGGYVAPNVPYMVGERGAELFVPSAAGKIVNSANMTSMPGQSTIVNQSINISAGVAQTVRAEIYSLLPQIKNETVAAVANARLRSA